MLISQLEIETDDIDLIFDLDCKDWDGSYTQLTRGRLGNRSRYTLVGGLKIASVQFGQKILIRDSYRGTDIRMGILVEAVELPKVRGNVASFDSGMVTRPQLENELLFPAGMETLDIVISAELAAKLSITDLSAASGQLQRLQENAREAMINSCRELSAAVNSGMQDNTWNGDTDEVLALRDRVLRTMQRAIRPWLADTRSSRSDGRLEQRRYELVTAAERFINQLSPHVKLEIGAIAGELGVSERTLYAAFNQCYGIAPYEYYLIRRLHRFRTDLLRGRPSRGKVTAVALDHGFEHFGRLTQQYTRLFGESPRATMMRRAG